MFIVSVVQKALSERQDLEEWKRKKIDAAITSADNGEGYFVEHDRVKEWLMSWGAEKEKPHPAFA